MRSLDSRVVSSHSCHGVNPEPFTNSGKSKFKTWYAYIVLDELLKTKKSTDDSLYSYNRSITRN